MNRRQVINSIIPLTVGVAVVPLTVGADTLNNEDKYWAAQRHIDRLEEENFRIREDQYKFEVYSYFK